MIRPGYVSSVPTREHVLKLRAAGVGSRRLARLSGVTRKTIQKIVRGIASVHWSTEQLILAVPAHAPLRVRYVDATGTRRRAQALAALGWSLREQATRLGQSQSSFRQVLRNPTVYVTTAAKVSALYDELSMTPPPSSGTVTRTKLWARQQGFYPPLAWDDHELDDPAASAHPRRVAA